MASVKSSMLALGTALPRFSLPDVDGNFFSHDEVMGEHGLLVAFWCNHCPYVKHLKSAFAELAKNYMNIGLGVVAINSNDAIRYPEDGPEGMIKDTQAFSYVFPYLMDETQFLAKSFEAQCTPEFYLFDKLGILQYRGRFDASTPRNDKPITGHDLRGAIEAMLNGLPQNQDQFPSIGCSIKWKN